MTLSAREYARYRKSYWHHKQMQSDDDATHEPPIPEIRREVLEGHNNIIQFVRGT